MRNTLFLLVGVIALYLVLAVGLQVIYGPSYGFLSGEDCWRPDGQGGWVKHGEPSEPPPAEPSQNIPIPVQYLPIFVPGLLLCAFLFTPLSRKLQAPEPECEDETTEDNQGAEPPGGPEERT